LRKSLKAFGSAFRRLLSSCICFRKSSPPTGSAPLGPAHKSGAHYSGSEIAKKNTLANHHLHNHVEIAMVGLGKKTTSGRDQSQFVCSPSTPIPPCLVECRLRTLYCKPPLGSTSLQNENPKWIQMLPTLVVRPFTTSLWRRAAGFGSKLTE